MPTENQPVVFVEEVAYNTVDANILESQSCRFGDFNLVLFFCGDDTQSKSVVATLIAQSGFEPFDVGGIQTSRFQRTDGATLG